MNMMAPRCSAAVIAILAVASSSCDFAYSLVVGNSQQSYILGRPFSRTAGSRSRSMAMYIDEMMPMPSIGVPLSFPSLPESASIASDSSNVIGATSKLIAPDPRLEVEILNGASFVALDVSTLLSPDTAWLRLCNVIGRVLILSEEYIQHDHVTPEEWVFQVFMLAVSCRMFAKSAWPLMKGKFSISTLTVRDRRTYALVFRALGISVLQFKTLLASRTLEWVEYDPGTLVELSGDYMYFLYSGEAVILAAADTIITESSNLSGSGGEGLRISTRIFGDVQFSKALDASLYKKSKKCRSDKMFTGTTGQNASDSTTNPPQGSFVAGRGGASTLRISTSKLLQLMENDDELSNSIQRLVLLCMEEKVNKSFQNGGLKMSFKKNVFDF